MNRLTMQGDERFAGVICLLGVVGNIVAADLTKRLPVAFDTPPCRETSALLR
jgi:hypothetical protein